MATATAVAQTQLWDPKELFPASITPPEELSLDVAHRNKQLLLALLDSNTHEIRVLSRMLPFLRQPAVRDLLLSFITRLNENEPEGTSNAAGCYRERDTDAIAVRRSWQAMMIFTTGATPLVDLLSSSDVYTFLDKLYTVFDVRSDANFWHFRAVFEKVAAKHTDEVLPLRKARIAPLLEYLHEPAIMDLVLSLPRQFCRSPKEKWNLCNLLSKLGVWNTVATKIASASTSPALVTSMMTFFHRAIHDMRTMEHAEVLFASLAETDAFVATLASGVTNSIPFTQRRECIRALHTAVFATTGSVTQVNYVGENMQATTLPNQLEQLHSKLLAHLVPFAEAFCNVLAASANPPPKRPPESAIVGGPCKYSSCEVKELLTEFRVTAITVLTQLATVYPQALDSFPLAFWRAVVNWFLEHKTSTMFLVATSKLFVQVIQSQRTETLKLLFTKLKFLSRIVTFYTTEAPSDAHAFILYLANYMRLTAELAAPSDYLRSCLVSHGAWQEFLPRLRADTLAQTPRLEVHESLAYHHGPSPFYETKFVPGIDLGSTYARSLGFGELGRPAKHSAIKVAPLVGSPTPAAANRPAQPQANAPIPAPEAPAPAATPATPPAAPAAAVPNKRKPRRKRKKPQQAGAAAAGEDSHDADDTEDAMEVTGTDESASPTS